jgi:hypothetical protein
VLRWIEVTAEVANVVPDGRIANKLCTEKHRTHDQQTRPYRRSPERRKPALAPLVPRFVARSLAPAGAAPGVSID